MDGGRGPWRPCCLTLVLCYFAANLVPEKATQTVSLFQAAELVAKIKHEKNTDILWKRNGKYSPLSCMALVRCDPEIRSSSVPLGTHLSLMMQDHNCLLDLLVFYVCLPCIPSTAMWLGSDALYFLRSSTGLTNLLIVRLAVRASSCTCYSPWSFLCSLTQFRIRFSNSCAFFTFLSAGSFYQTTDKGEVKGNQFTLALPSVRVADGGVYSASFMGDSPLSSASYRLIVRGEMVQCRPYKFSKPWYCCMRNPFLGSLEVKGFLYLKIVAQKR